MNEQEIFEVVKKVALEVLPFIPADLITIDKSMKDLGANSIDRMEVVTQAMERLAVKVPLVEFGKTKNIKDLVGVFHKYKN